MKSAANVALLFCFFSCCCAQAQTSPGATNPSANTSSTNSDDSMVLIHGGAFQMGIDKADIPRFQKIFAIENVKLFEDELPRHAVSVKDFYMDKNLVTNAQFRAFVDAKLRSDSGRSSERLDNGNYLQHWNTPSGDNAKPDHPVVNVNWYAAVAYCHWVGKRLPTEAEWEFAARGGRDSLFPWGDDPPDETRANFNNNVGTTTPVGSYPANSYGLFDMAGNVWQFLSDRWEPYYPDAGTSTERNVRSNSPDLKVSVLHPTSPRHVIRGGSYAGASINLWLEYRDSHPANGSQPFVGFRCAKSAVNPASSQH